MHLHVIPRFEGDGFGLKYGPGNFLRKNRSELDQTAEKIRKALKLE